MTQPRLPNGLKQIAPLSDSEIAERVGAVLYATCGSVDAAVKLVRYLMAEKFDPAALTVDSVRAIVTGRFVERAESKGDFTIDGVWGTGLNMFAGFRHHGMSPNDQKRMDELVRELRWRP